MATAATTQFNPVLIRRGSPAPTTFDHARQQMLRGNGNYHSTSLRNILTNGVNKTALHPTGVQ